jgi:WD40 repeat protein
VHLERPDLPSEMTTLVARMLAKRPEDRFQTAGEVAELLALWQADPVAARRRLEALDAAPRAALAPADGPVLSPGTAVPVPPGPATASTPGAASPRSLARRTVSIATAALVILAVSVAWLLSALAPSPSSRDGSIGLSSQPDSPFDALQLRRPLAIPDWSPPRELVAVRPAPSARHWGSVHCLAFCPDQKELASGGADAAIRLWDATTLESRGVLRGHVGRVTCLRYLPTEQAANGAFLVSGGDGGTILVWKRLPDSRPTAEVLGQHQGGVTSLVVSPDGRRLASLGSDRKVRLWDLEKLALASASPEGASVNAITFLGNRRLALGDESGKVMLWDVEMSRAIGELHNPRADSNVRVLAASSDGRRLLVGYARNLAAFWQFASENDRGKLVRLNLGYVTAADFHPDGQLAVTVSRDRLKLHSWNLAAGWEAWRRSLSPPHPVSALAAGANGQCAFGDLEGQVRIWDARQPSDSLTKDGKAGVTAACFDHQVGTLLLGGDDGTLERWDAATDRRSVVARLGQPILAVSVGTFQGQPWRAAATRDGTMHFANVAEHKEYSIQDRSQSIVAVAFDLSHLRAVVATQEGLHLWHLTGPKTVLHKTEGNELRNRFVAVRFSPDGTRLGYAQVHVARCLEMRDRTMRQRPHEPGTIAALAFSADGNVLVEGRRQGTVRLWNLTTDSTLSLTMPSGVESIGFAPSGNEFAVSCRDGQVHVWDDDHRALLPRFKLPGPVRELVYAPDGRHLVTVNADGSVFLFRLAEPPRP